MYFNIAIVILNILILLVIFLLFKKIRKIHLGQNLLESAIETHSSNLFSQIETLIGLYIDLRFNKSLPRTRGWACSPDFLWHIARLAQQNKPLVIVECSSGVSTIVLAQCLKLNGTGHVYSMDHDSVFAEKTRQELNRLGLNEWVDVIDAPITKHKIDNEDWLWYSLENFPNDIAIDMIVIDGPPVHIAPLARYPAGPLLFDKLKQSGVIVLDDTNRESEQLILNRWQVEFKKLVQTNIGCEKGCTFLHRQKGSV